MSQAGGRGKLDKNKDKDKDTCRFPNDGMKWLSQLGTCLVSRGMVAGAVTVVTRGSKEKPG